MLLHLPAEVILLDPPGARVTSGYLAPAVVLGVELGTWEEQCMIFTTELCQTPQIYFYTLYSQLTI